MAITLVTTDYNKGIGTQTDSIIRANSNLWNAFPDFSYVVDIFPQGFTFNGGNQLRFFIKPNPSSGQMVFNLSRALKNIANPDIITPDEINTINKYITQKSTVGKVVLVTVREFYSGAIQSSTASQRFSVVYGAYRHDRAVYYMPSNMGTGYKVRGKKYWNVGNNLLFDNIRWYSPNLVTIGYFIRIYNSFTGGLLAQINNANSLMPMDVSASNTFSGGVYSIGNNIVSNNINTLGALLNLLNGGNTYLEVTQKLVDGANTYYYTVSRQYNTNHCNTDGVMLYFHNPDGFIEHYYFPVVKVITNVDKQSLSLEKYDANGNTRYGYKFGINNSNVATERIKVTTDLINNDDDYTLLSYLLTSTDVYMNYVNDDKLYWCKVVDTNYNAPKTLYDKVKQVSFTIETIKIINS